MENYFASQKDRIFKNVEVLIYVFDVESRDWGSDLHYYQSCLDAIRANSQDAKIFCLIHKMDLLPEHQREQVRRSLPAITENSDLDIPCLDIWWTYQRAPSTFRTFADSRIPYVHLGWNIVCGMSAHISLHSRRYSCSKNSHRHGPKSCIAWYQTSGHWSPTWIISAELATPMRWCCLKERHSWW